MPGGRPRSFDPDAALAAALRVFWERGFREASTEDLAAAAGVTKPSLYAAFGDKHGQFAAAVGLYRDRHFAPLLARLDDPPGERRTGREAVRAFLRGAAEDFTDPDRPPGCLLCAHAAGAGGTDERALAAALAGHEALVAALRDRLARAKSDGDLPAAAPVAPLADLYAAALHGLSASARVGRSRRALFAVADAAVGAWPGG